MLLTCKRGALTCKTLLLLHLSTNNSEPYTQAELEELEAAAADTLQDARDAAAAALAERDQVQAACSSCFVRGDRQLEATVQHAMAG